MNSFPLAALLNGTCEETTALLSEHLDGGLRGLRRLRVLRHLARCPRCAEALRTLRLTIEGLRSLRSAEPSAEPALAEEILERLRRELAGPPE